MLQKRENSKNFEQKAKNTKFEETFPVLTRNLRALQNGKGKIWRPFCSFKCYTYCLVKKYGGQIHIIKGEFLFPNFKLVSKGHKRIGNQKLLANCLRYGRFYMFAFLGVFVSESFPPILSSLGHHNSAFKPTRNKSKDIFQQPRKCRFWKLLYF